MSAAATRPPDTVHMENNRKTEKQHACTHSDMLTVTFPLTHIHTDVHQSHVFEAGNVYAVLLRDIAQHPSSLSQHKHTPRPDWRVLGRKGESLGQK